ncbi:NAD(P)/FAD-dependent oxidoreductase [Nocardia rhizosphaerihabitans]|uniref:NAD(P)/FAD-dependent oxidoreductase n=1 Tax=Nocardia rhizosphaerihabitans TaxID=1691570 RepID=UPI00366D11F3
MTGIPEHEVDVLLIGGGVAAAGAAEELRRKGFSGSIALATRESEAPYHRFYLTKDYLRGTVAADDLTVHSPEWWQHNDVQLWLRSPVQSLDPDAKTARVGRRTVRWDKALLATGANVRLLDCPGAGLAGVHYLRTTWNADELRKDLQTANELVVIGGSFVAAETAASAAASGVRTTMVFPEPVPLARSLGAPVGRIVEAELTRLGVVVYSGVTVESLRGDDRVSGVVLAGGAELAADTVVVGIGARPEVTLAKRCGLGLGETGGVLCDSTLRTSDENIWAAGDVCEFDSIRHGRSVRIEHDRVASAQGRHAARAMLGDDVSFTTYPYFWTTIGADLHIDVMAIEAPGHEAVEWELPVRPDRLAMHAAAEYPGPEPAVFYYRSNGETTGYAMVNGELSLPALHGILTDGHREIGRPQAAFGPWLVDRRGIPRIGR